MFVIPFMAYDI